MTKTPAIGINLTTPLSHMAKSKGGKHILGRYPKDINLELINHNLLEEDLFTIFAIAIPPSKHYPNTTTTKNPTNSPPGSPQFDPSTRIYNSKLKFSHATGNPYPTSKNNPEPPLVDPKNNPNKNPPRPLKYTSDFSSNLNCYSKKKPNKNYFPLQQLDQISYYSRTNRTSSISLDIPHSSLQSFLDPSSSVNLFNSINNPPTLHYTAPNEYSLDIFSPRNSKSATFLRVSSIYLILTNQPLSTLTTTFIPYPDLPPCLPS